MQITLFHILSVYTFMVFVSLVTVLEINRSENYGNAFQNFSSTQKVFEVDVSVTTVFTRISAASGTKKVNKRRPRISAAPPMLSPLIFSIMKLSGFFHRVNFPRNSRFAISLESVHRKINR